MHILLKGCANFVRRLCQQSKAEQDQCRQLSHSRHRIRNASSEVERPTSQPQTPHNIVSLQENREEPFSFFVNLNTRVGSNP